jgi:hypothetical protein
MLAMAWAGCVPGKGHVKKGEPAGVATFKEDAAFLKKHTETVILKSGHAEVAVCPALQGRVATSTATGSDGVSIGWINRDLIASGKSNPHFNAYGGEDRLWIGPEGGQFSIYFKKDAPFDLEHWYTPAAFNSEPWETILKKREEVIVGKDMHLENYSGTTFDLRVRRSVHLMAPGEVEKALGMVPPRGVNMVAYESVNTIRNTGKEPWKKETGLLSMWILGMMNASADTTIVVPFVPGPESELGPIVNDTYFGKVPADRLKTVGDHLFFKADAKYRSKIGLSPKRAKPVLGSYDARNKILTVVQYTMPKGVTDYVNSMWEIQKDPYAGDAANSYNNGPKTGADQVDQFYELESSSPACALGPGESATHVHRTFHFQGSEDALDKIATAALGTSLDEIKKAFQ